MSAFNSRWVDAVSTVRDRYHHFYTGTGLPAWLIIVMVLSFSDRLQWSDSPWFYTVAFVILTWSVLCGDDPPYALLVVMFTTIVWCTFNKNVSERSRRMLPTPPISLGADGGRLTTKNDGD